MLPARSAPSARWSRTLKRFWAPRGRRAGVVRLNDGVTGRKGENGTMYADFIYPEYEVVRNNGRCIACRACERQCANEVHRYDAEERTHDRRTTPSASTATGAWRCCPARALKIVNDRPHASGSNANWHQGIIEDVYRQAADGRRAAVQPWATPSPARSIGTDC